MSFQIKKAVKSAAKLRMAVFGPSGAGKTMTSLRVAHGLGGKVGVIDTERGSASKYSDRWPFDVIELDDHDIRKYTGAIRAFADAGYDVLVVDSLTHAWDWLLAFVDKLGATKYRGNKWSAWSEATPMQQALIDAILSYPGHVIATMRAKTEWAQETDDRGKTKPVRIGMGPKQREGVEYEFDLLLELNTENVGRFIKDRTGRYQDVVVEKPGEDLGRELAAWLSDGAPAQAQPATAPRDAGTAAPLELGQQSGEPTGPATAAQRKAIAAALKPHKLTPEEAQSVVEAAVGRSLPDGSASLTLEEGERLARMTSEDWAPLAADFKVPGEEAA